MRKINRKSQQEIVGFVIIVVIVMIIGVVFLGMFLKPKGGIAREDAEISNFLVSSAKITTDCVKGNEPNYRTLGDLTEDCFLRRKCLDERDSCEVLKEGYEKLLNETWTIEFRGMKGYAMSFYYQEFIDTEDGLEYAPKQVFLEISEGNSSVCSVRRAGSYAVDIGTGDIVSELETCKK